MSADDELLAELRLVFREELEDHVGSLEREALALARPDADDATRAAAVAEIYRAAHSLKGAARAVQYNAVERFCHALESQLGPARRDPSAFAARVRDAADIAGPALRAWSAALATGAAPPDAVLLEAQKQLEWAKASTPTTPRAQPPAPASPQPPAISSPVAPATRLGETVRVPVARLGDLLASSEDLLALAGRHHAAGPGHEAQFVDLRADARRAHELLRARDLVRGTPAHDEALRLLERVVVATQTAEAAALERGARDAGAWRSVAASAGDLSARARALRVVAFSTLAPALERAALDAAEALGRRVTLVVHGGDVEFDRRVRDALREPLLHLVRNAVDHGIEPPDERADAGKDPAGRITLSAALAGRDVRVVVEDDGRGVDRDAVLSAARERGIDEAALTEPDAFASLIFEAGLTTRGTATAISGRGVGLDVVRSRIAEMHGRVEVGSAPGAGTRFSLTIPVDLTVIRGLLVDVRDTRMVIVTTAVARLVRVAPSDAVAVGGRLYLREPDGMIPLADLDEVLGLSHRGASRIAAGEARPCVVLAVGDRRAAFCVDALVDERDLVVKPLGPRVRRAAFVAGATVLADGEVAPVLDAADLLRLARPAASPDAAGASVARPRRRVLVVDDSVTTRQLERSILESAGYEVSVAADGAQAWELLSGPGAFDVVVSDIEMPRMDGFQLVARARATAKTARLPIVLVTALDRAADRERAMDLGASAYVIKSGFDQEVLLEAIEQLL